MTGSFAFGGGNVSMMNVLGVGDTVQKKCLQPLTQEVIHEQMQHNRCGAEFRESPVLARLYEYVQVQTPAPRLTAPAKFP